MDDEERAPLRDSILEYALRVVRPNDELVSAANDVYARSISPDVIRVLSAYAQAGDPFALCRLAEYYLLETGPEFDPHKARKLATKAADLQFAPANYLLALCFESGVGCRQDMQLARAHLELAAEGGFGPAALQFASAVEEGRLQVKDASRVVDLLSLCAVLDAPCALTLARWYEHGLLVPKDDARAVHWYRQSSELGSNLASLRLGMAYSAGELGLKRDDVLSAKYLEVRENKGDLI
jgi:TPR repeat protein